MKRLCLLAIAGLVSGQALAVGRLADVSVVDRSTGETLTTHYYRGEYWVAGRPGARYAITIRNQIDRRLLAVTSVDGVNVITGQTAASDQNGYVFSARSSYDIAGWRKSDAEIAAFEFTSVPRSYAAQTGRPQNVGVIGVALFREKLQATMEQIAEAAPMLPAPPPSAESRAADAANETSKLGSAARSPADGARQEREQRLGTGHGRRESSYVTHVDFERERSRPNELVRIRYDSRENLVAMGIIRVPPLRQRPQPFPGEPVLGYVPDP